MEYAQYQHNPQNPQPHITTAYPTSAGGNNITSPQSAHIQQSPVLPSQQQTTPTQTHAMYQPNYGMPQGMQYGVPGIQAAAMAATAAASGSGYAYQMSQDSSIPQTSPRMGGGVKTEKSRDPRSPQQMNSMQQQRRMSTVTSPGVPTPQAMMNHAASRGSVSGPMAQAPAMQHPQSPEMTQGGQEESPLYVNAKQFHRILKRRVARQRLEEALRLTSKGRKPYLHESRHNHAMRRPRGPGGRFLTADEVAEIERKKAGGVDGGNENDEDGVSSVKSGTKRKSEADSDTSNKKAKTGTESAEEDEDDDNDDE